MDVATGKWLLWKLGLLKSNPESEWDQIEDNMKEEARTEEDKDQMEKKLGRAICWTEYYAILGKQPYKDQWKRGQYATDAYADDAKLWRQ